MAAKRQRGSPELVMLPLGGTGEIGMNCYCYGSGAPEQRQWLMVDLGVKFGGEKEPGVDLILPDIGYITSNVDDLVGLVITHAHEDHIGAIAWLWPQLRCDIHCTAFAAELITLKLREAGLDDEVRLVIHEPGDTFTLGHFSLTLVPVTHSIPQSNMLLIETEQGRVLHSGDWKIDRTPHMGMPFEDERFSAIGARGIDAFVCDSTNVLREGLSPSERDVTTTLTAIVQNAEGRVAITTFASHVERISCAIKAARAAGREVAVVGRAMRNTIEAARICGLLRDTGKLLDEDAFGYLPRDKVMLLCTGSQGEPRAAMARIAEDSHPNVALEEGDTVIFSARTIPGNEKEVSAVLNNLAKLGINLITTDDALVHSSGHPRQGELKLMYELIKPKVVVPMHGEPRHMRAHLTFAKSCGVPDSVLVEDGQILRLAPGPAQVVDEAHNGVLHVDGKLIVSGVDGPAKERRKLSFVGIIVAAVVLDRDGQLRDDVQIVCDGVPDSLEGELEEAAETALQSLPKQRRRDDSAIEEVLRVGLRRCAESIWDKRPVVKVVVFRT
jgi:ribonuclease J